MEEWEVWEEDQEDILDKVAMEGDRLMVVLEEWEANSKIVEMIMRWVTSEEIQEVDQMLDLFNHKEIKINKQDQQAIQEEAVEDSLDKV